MDITPPPRWRTGPGEMISGTTIRATLPDMRDTSRIVGNSGPRVISDLVADRRSRRPSGKWLCVTHSSAATRADSDHYGTGRPAAAFPVVMAYLGLEGPSRTGVWVGGPRAGTPRCVAQCWLLPNSLFGDRRARCRNRARETTARMAAPRTTSATPMVPKPMAARELGELSDEEWSATTKAISMLATMQMPPPAARPVPSRAAGDDPGRRAPLLMISP
jgi:hypothetical protein